MKAKLLYSIILVFLLSIKLNAQKLTFGFYTISKKTKELCFVDTLGNVTTIGHTGFHGYYWKYYSLDFNPKTNELYFIGSYDSIFKINTETGKANFQFLPKEISLGSRIHLGLTFDNEGNMYTNKESMGYKPGLIYRRRHGLDDNFLPLRDSLNIETGIAIEYIDSSIYLIDECCKNRLHNINPNTGHSNWTSTNRLHQDVPTELDYVNGTLYGISIGEENRATSTQFYQVDIKNGDTRNIFKLNEIYFGLAGGYRYIPPPFWETWLGIGLEIFALIVLLAFLLFFNFKFAQKRAQKAAVIESQKKTLALQALKARINPEALTSGLLSILGFIQKDNKQQALNYFNKYSKLTRNIFESSQEESTTLENELEIIAAFLELEKLRFPCPLETELIVDEQIDPTFDRISPLLLQPIIEYFLWEMVVKHPSIINGNLTVKIDSDQVKFFSFNLLFQANSGIITDIKQEDYLRHMHTYKKAKTRLELIFMHMDFGNNLAIAYVESAGTNTITSKFEFKIPLL